jgi:hypothetical protein
MTSAISSFGVLVKKGDGGSPEVFATIAELLDIEGPSLELDTEEVTSHASTDGWAEYIGTILDAGEVTFDVNYVPTNATHNASTGLIKDMVNRTKRNFQIVFSDSGNTTWAFTALVTKMGPAAPVRGALRGSVTLRITGKPTLV